MKKEAKVGSEGRQAGAPTVVRQTGVGEEALALTTLSRIDYTDGFLADLRSAEGLSGEEWARETLEGAPDDLRRRLRQGWTALGLRLERDGSEQAVLGWELRHADADFALLAADSRIGMPAELLFRPEGDALFFATFVRQSNPVTRAVWAVVGPRHRRAVPYLLARAVGRRRKAG